MQKSLMATVILKKSAGTAKIVLFKNENGGRAGAY